jgi:ankyrin repeat protein
MPLHWNTRLDERKQLLDLKMMCKSFKLAVHKNSFLGELGVLVMGYAVIFDNLCLLELALEGGVDVDGEIRISDTWRRIEPTPLFCAISSNNLKIVQALLRAGASTSARNIYSDTPLLYATTQNRLEIVTALLDANVDVNAVSNCGGTAIHHAEEPKLLRLLVGAGANPNIVELPWKRGPLHAATRKAKFSQVLALLEVGANPNAQDEAGITPLHEAIHDYFPAERHQRIKIIKALLAYGANRFIKDHLGFTALDRANRIRFSDAAAILASDDCDFHGNPSS